MSLLAAIGRPFAGLALAGLVVASVTGCTGCKFLKKDDAADAAVVAAPVEDAGAAVAEVDAAVAPTSTTTKVVVKDPDQVPTPVDDEKMVAQVSKANYKAELDRVEKDVNGEK